LFNCSFISDVRTCLKLKQFLKQFRRVGKYANAAETVSEFYFSFISPCETDALQTTVEMLVSVRRAAAARTLAERRDEGRRRSPTLNTSGSGFTRPAPLDPFKGW